MADEPRDYEKIYRRTLPGSLRERIGLTTDHGEVTRFAVQLEYLLEDEWRTVVRYDHDGTAVTEFGHDVADEGLHVDIYRNGRKQATEFITGPLPAGIALDHAEDHLAKNLQRYVERFEEWHGIRSP